MESVGYWKAPEEVVDEEDAEEGQVIDGGKFLWGVAIVESVLPSVFDPTLMSIVPGWFCWRLRKPFRWDFKSFRASLARL